MNFIALKAMYIYTIIYDFFEKILYNIGETKLANMLINKYNDIMIIFNNLNVEPSVPYIEVSYITINNKLKEIVLTNYKKHRILNYYTTIVNEIYNDTMSELYNKRVLCVHKFNYNDNNYIQCKLIDKKTTDTSSTHKENSDAPLLDILTHKENSDKYKYNFMGIEYSHPKMENSITLDIDSNYFVPNNDVLDAIFIYKYLKRNFSSSTYFFDKNYKISIMDSNVNFHELTYNKYIHFDSNGKDWKIKEIIE